MSIVDAIAKERAEAIRELRRTQPESALKRLVSPPRPVFRGKPPFALIAECKRASPSRGLIAKDYDPVRLARAYERGGAALVSVLTEPLHFLGEDRHLAEVRAAVSLPVLRKDFIVDPWQVAESWSLGADVILLIASLHDAGSLRDLVTLAHARSLEVLLEVHEEAELERALAAGPDAIGVNTRDLRDFTVHAGRAAELASCLGEAAFKVAESGMKVPADAATLFRSGFRGFLVGEALVASADPEAATAAFAASLSDEVAQAAFAGRKAAADRKASAGRWTVP